MSPVLRRVLRGLAALMIAGLAAAAPAAPLAITGVTVIPMDDGPARLADRIVVIDGGRIQAVGPRGAVPVPAGARVIDGRGKFLIPGLVDAHVHLEHVADPAILKLFLGHGVTTIRNMDGRDFVLAWRRQVAEGALTGPRIITAGPVLDGAPPLRPDNLSIADAAAGRATVAAQAAQGYDFVKVYTNLSADAFAGIASEAERRGLRIAGHVPRTLPLDDAMRRYWTIEHLGDFAGAVAAEGAPVPGWARRFLAATPDPARMDAVARRLAASPAWLVPTLLVAERELAPPAAVAVWLAEPAVQALPGWVRDQWQGQLARIGGRLDAEDFALLAQARGHREALLRAVHRAGAKLAIGTDTPNPFVVPGAAVHDELAAWVQAGLAPRAALAAATAAPARMLGLADQGQVAPGMRADLLLLDADPLTDIAATRRIAGLVAAGRWHGPEELAEFRRALAALPPPGRD